MSAHLTIRPGVAFGAPCVGKGGSPAWALAGCIWAGDGVDEVAADYGCTRDEVIVACWYLATYGVESAWWNGEKRHRPGAVWTKRWGAWAREHERALLHHKFNEVPDPPCRGEE